jgi:hypothetical protein
MFVVSRRQPSAERKSRLMYINNSLYSPAVSSFFDDKKQKKVVSSARTHSDILFIAFILMGSRAHLGAMHCGRVLARRASLCAEAGSLFAERNSAARYALLALKARVTLRCRTAQCKIK